MRRFAVGVESGAATPVGSGVANCGVAADAGFGVVECGVAADARFGVVECGVAADARCGVVDCGVAAASAGWGASDMKGASSLFPSRYLMGNSKTRSMRAMSANFASLPLPMFGACSFMRAQPNLLLHLRIQPNLLLHLRVQRACHYTCVSGRTCYYTCVSSELVITLACPASLSFYDACPAELVFGESVLNGYDAFVEFAADGPRLSEAV